MKIIRANDMGMCFGVRDALKMVDDVADPTKVTIHGELVHNPRVIYQLGVAGFSQSSEEKRDNTPDTPQVLITAHGISDRERVRLESSGKELIDTTCPLVRRAHDAAMQLAAEGRHVLLIGKPGHVEVQGIVEDLQSHDVVPSVEAVREYTSKMLGIVCQTTMPSSLLDEIRERISLLNGDADIRFIDTVCHPTKRRQQAILDLIQDVDAVVVVGGKNSNNTRRLAALCEQHGVPALHVECAGELNPNWFDGHEVIGLTAGTSTLDSTITAVETRLASLVVGKTDSNEVSQTPDLSLNSHMPFV